eukprot:1750139-Rhodomonas_salina.3
MIAQIAPMPRRCRTGPAFRLSLRVQGPGWTARTDNLLEESSCSRRYNSLAKRMLASFDCRRWTPTSIRSSRRRVHLICMCLVKHNNDRVSI